MSEVVVVGAGRCGLRAAAMLAPEARITLVERLPAAGGQDPEGLETDELAAAAVRSGAALLLGTCAVSWDGGVLTALGVDGVSRLSADALVVATGSRPATRGELGIAGDRCAGVLPVSAAVHLTESGVLLGRNPLVVGGGADAAHCAQMLLTAGAGSVAVVSPVGANAPMPPGTHSYVGWNVDRIEGTARVASVLLARGSSRERVLTDAVVLAAGRVPARNIEGAVFGGPGVVFCQSDAEPKTAAASEAAAEDAAAAVRQLIVREES